jgi:hypothetical protein
MCLEIFKLRNERNHTFRFQVDPPITYSDSVQNIALQDSEVLDGNSVVVTG